MNPGEYLQIVFNLKSGKTYADTLNALALGGASPGLRIGIHVQGFASGGSERLHQHPGRRPSRSPERRRSSASGSSALRPRGAAAPRSGAARPRAPRPRGRGACILGVLAGGGWRGGARVERAEGEGEGRAGAGRGSRATSDPSRWTFTSRSTRPTARPSAASGATGSGSSGRCARSSCTPPISASPGRASTRPAGSGAAARRPPDRERVEITFAEPVPAGEAMLDARLRAGSCAATCAASTRARAGERALRLHAARGRRRAPLLPVLRRAGDEGALPALGHDARARNTVLSNEPGREGRAARRRPQDRALPPTPPLSTYLVALAVGELEALGARALRRHRDPRLARARARSSSPASRSRPRASASRGSRRTSTCPTRTRSSTSSPCPTSRPARWRTRAPSSSARRCCSSTRRP